MKGAQVHGVIWFLPINFMSSLNDSFAKRFRLLNIKPLIILTKPHCSNLRIFRHIFKIWRYV
ncbi:hypothetical protein AWY79_17060 [Pseudodesulfovibrio indicus]|uniref:Uncharacterized protein n=1 Tax=Pseudodesulfovibrio indicus TaxID=1716143 RepID=A0ABM5YYK9_9BACT|nr:hypothetical protein AWY79_17060 [Pseudodesulfovibrio indicus]